MGSFLEISKIAIATYLHNSWKKIYVLLKVYLTIALVFLSIISYIGISSSIGIHINSFSSYIVTS
jgi:hypothetical protein